MTDELALRRAQRGDAAAFEALMMPLEGMVWRVCYHYTGQAQDAQDCAQEAMLKAWRSLPGYRGENRFESWLYRICVSCCLDYLRARRRRPTVSADELAEAGFDPADPAPPPEETVLAGEEKAALRGAIDALPEEMRTVLILYALEGRRYEEIAEITGSAVGTVKSRLNRAREKISAQLSKRREHSGKTSVQHHEGRTKA